MCVKNEKPKTVQLPEQHTLCSNPNSGCRYVEVKNGRKSWQKSLMVLIKEDGEPDAKLFIYTYFLKGIGAGTPLIGQIYSLNKPKELKAKKAEDGNIIMKIVTEQKLELTFKISGKDGALWVAAVMSGSFNLISHETHAPLHEKKTGSKSKSVKSIEKLDELSKLDKPHLKQSPVQSVDDGLSSKRKMKSSEETLTLKTNVSGKGRTEETEEKSKTKSEETEDKERSEH